MATLMSEVENIRDYIICNPYEVQPRFALADALEEVGMGEQGMILRNSTLLGMWPETREDAVALETPMTESLHNVKPYPINLKLHIANGVEIELASIAPAGFMMGCPPWHENPPEEEIYHAVELTHGFYMGIYNVTQEQYQAAMGVNPSHFKGPKRPVEQVTWEDANNFCKKMTELCAPPGWYFDLPTEAQWEYCCKAGTSTPYHYGETLTAKMANIYQPGAAEASTCDVGKYMPNAFGLYDMHGNVWEWCKDYYSRDAYKPGNRFEEP